MQIELNKKEAEALVNLLKSTIRKWEWALQNGDNKKALEIIKERIGYIKSLYRKLGGVRSEEIL
jgi:hypothetical protein